MTIYKCIALGLEGNDVSKKITGTSEVSAGRTVVAAGSGAVMGASVGGAVAIGATAAGIATAPVTVPLAAGAAVVAGICSLFD